MKKVLKIVYRVYAVFCMCVTAILFIGAIVLLINFGRIVTFLVTNFPELQPFLQ